MNAAKFNPKTLKSMTLPQRGLWACSKQNQSNLQGWDREKSAHIVIASAKKYPTVRDIFY